jgi:hypothetical protein
MVTAEKIIQIHILLHEDSGTEPGALTGWQRIDKIRTEDTRTRFKKSYSYSLLKPMNLNSGHLETETSLREFIPKCCYALNNFRVTNSCIHGDELYRHSSKDTNNFIRIKLPVNTTIQ